jgi:hypothetical protein
MKLRKDTTFERAALSQELRKIVDSDIAEEDAIRRVVLSIPFGTDIFISLTEDSDTVFGVNRTYKCPVARPGADMEMRLRSNQQIWGAAKQGATSIAVLIEYWAAE